MTVWHRLDNHLIKAWGKGRENGESWRGTSKKAKNGNNLHWFEDFYQQVKK
jgi:hypothetical protein